ncbi:MAG: hypothetical protein HOV67_12040 [Kribbellaceae bacterium]|nr:hypothetical protein [Kribbellaceae bacterium]
MQSVTLGEPSAYLRLATPPHLPEVPAKYARQQERRYLDAELRAHDLTAKCRLDLFHDYGGLVPFFDQVAAYWQEWDNSSVVWGLHGGLRLEFRRGPRPALGPDHLQVRIELHSAGRRTFWRVETLLVISPEELDAFVRDLHELCD